MTPTLATPLFDPMHVPANQLRNEGWMHLRYGRKAHFFRNNVSLCGKFKVEGRNFRMYGEITAFDPKMDCPVCFKRGSASIPKDIDDFPGPEDFGLPSITKGNEK